MVLGWAVVVLMIYGLFIYNPAAKNDRPYLGRESLERLYSEQYGESPHFDGGTVFQCMGLVARHRSR